MLHKFNESNKQLSTHIQHEILLTNGQEKCLKAVARSCNVRYILYCSGYVASFIPMLILFSFFDVVCSYIEKIVKIDGR